MKQKSYPSKMEKGFVHGSYLPPLPPNRDKSLSNSHKMDLFDCSGRLISIFS